MGLLDTIFTYDVAIYWAPQATRSSFGRVAYDEPIEIEVRWQASTEVIKDKNGAEVVTSAKIYVDRDLEEQGMLKHDSLESTTEDDPHEETGARQIIKFDKLPNIKHTKYLRTAYV